MRSRPIGPGDRSQICAARTFCSGDGTTCDLPAETSSGNCALPVPGTLLGGIPAGLHSLVRARLWAPSSGRPENGRALPRVRHPPPRLCPHPLWQLPRRFPVASSCKTRYFCPPARPSAWRPSWNGGARQSWKRSTTGNWCGPFPGLRPTFRRDRRLLGELARCAWTTLQDYAQAQSLDRAAAAGAIVAIQCRPTSCAPVSPELDSTTMRTTDRSSTGPPRG